MTADAHPAVVDALTSGGAEGWQVVRHDELDRPVRGPQDVADALGRDVGSITKTLLVRDRRSEAYALVVCPVLAKVDFAALGTVLGSRHEVASREELAAVVGYPVTGVTPLGVAGIGDTVRVVVDPAVTAHASVLTGGGSAGVEVELSPGDLVGLTGAVVAPVVR